MVVVDEEAELGRKLVKVADQVTDAESNAGSLNDIHLLHHNIVILQYLGAVCWANSFTSGAESALALLNLNQAVNLLDVTNVE